VLILRLESIEEAWQGRLEAAKQAHEAEVRELERSHGAQVETLRCEVSRVRALDASLPLPLTKTPLLEDQLEAEVARRVAKQNADLHRQVDALVDDLKTRTDQQMVSLFHKVICFKC